MPAREVDLKLVGGRVGHGFRQGSVHVAFLVKRCPWQREEVHHPNDNFFLAQILEGTHCAVLPLLAVVMGHVHGSAVCKETDAA